MSFEHEPVTERKPIHLTFRSVEQVMVEPDDEDRFLTTAQEAARACQQAQAGKEWSEAFNGFLSYIHRWCKKHSDQVESAYVDVGDGCLHVNICLLSEHFDFEFEDQITELDIELAQQFPGCIAEVTQIPKQVSLSSEPLTGRAVVVYGHAG